MTISPTLRPVLLAMLGAAAGTMVFGGDARGVDMTTAETSGQIQIIPNSDRTEPDIHTVEIVPQTINIKDNGVTTVSFQVGKIEDVGTVNTGDLIIMPPLATLASWNTNIDPLIFTPPQQDIVVCGTGVNVVSNKTIKIDLSKFTSGNTKNIDLVKKAACVPAFTQTIILYVNNNQCDKMAMQTYTKDTDYLLNPPSLIDSLLFTATCEDNNGQDSAPPVTLTSYQSDSNEVTVRVLDTVDNNVANSSTASRLAFDDFVHAFDHFLQDVANFIKGAFDFDPPVLTVSPNQVVTATSPQGAAVVFGASSVDVLGIDGKPVDPAPLVACKDQFNNIRVSGNTFGIGHWVVTCFSFDHKYDLIQDKFVLGNPPRRPPIRPFRSVASHAEVVHDRCRDTDEHGDLHDDVDRDRHCHRDGNGNQYRDAHRDAYSEQHRDGHCDIDQHRNPHRDGDTHVDGHAHADGNADLDAHAHTYVDADVYAHAHADRHAARTSGFQCGGADFCADHVCCSTACSAPGEACNVLGTTGTCTVVAAPAPAASRTAILFAIALLIGIGGWSLYRTRAP